MVFSSYKQRSLARQTGIVNFQYDVTIDNTTGYCLFGLSGTNALTFSAASGKIYDPNGKFVSSYAANKSFGLSGQVKGALLDYSINDERVGVGVPVAGGNYDWLIVSPQHCSVDLRASMQGELPDYSIVNTGKYYAAHAQVSASVINNIPARPFRIFSVANVLQNSPFSVVGFTTGNITNTGYITVQSSQTGLSDYVVPLAVETNFGNLSFNFQISGDYTETPRFYVSLFPQTPLIKAGSSVDMDVDFSYYPSGMPMSISLDYVSGITGNIYAFRDVSTGLSSRLISGFVTGGAPIIQNETGLITGTGAFGDNWSTTGSGVFQSDYVYPTGFLSEIWTAVVYGTGQGTIGARTFLDLPVYGYITGLVTGNAVSGVLNYDFQVTGQPQNSGFPPGYSGVFSAIVSGYRAASASVLVNELTYGDYITLGGVTTSYNPYEPAPPYLFGSMAQLIDILNGYPQFGVTASQIGGQAGVSGIMQLSALDVGEVGNISLEVSGGISVSGDIYSLTGGATQYYSVRANSPYAYYTGRVTNTLYATGFFTATGSGELSGRARMIDKVRSFTGTWGLQTGELDYLSAGLVSGITRYANPLISTFSGVANTVAIKNLYKGDYIPAYPDIARLTVTGVGTNSGVQITFSGIY